MTIVVNATGNQDIDGILWGWAWGSGGPLNLTFSFPSGTAEYTDNGYVAIDDDFTQFNAAQQTAVRNALANIASFSGLTFTETTATFAVLRYAEASSVNYTDNDDVATNTGLHTIGTAEANPPELEFDDTAPFSAPYAQGDSWYNPNNYNNPVLGGYQNAAGIMHETGHNLGLKHGHVTQDGHGHTFPTLPADHDSLEYSVMTYRQFPGNPIQPLNNPHYPTTYMQDDIAALQYLYGANYGATAHNGNTTYTWSPTTGEWFIDGTGQGAPYQNFVLMTVWDGGGVDTYDFSNYTTDLSVDLDPGAWTILDTSTARLQRANLGNNSAVVGSPTYFARGNIANALVDPNQPGETASLIDNATGGSGDDSIAGNSIANVLFGGAGSDTIDGRGGTDTAVFSGARSHYRTSEVGGAVRITDQRAGSPDGADSVSNVEFFRFSNRTYSRNEVLNQPPVLSADPHASHPLTEIAATTGSSAPDTATEQLGFTDDSGDTHTAAAAIYSSAWSGGAAVPASSQTALAGAMAASIATDGSSGFLEWLFSLADRHVDFLAVGETLTAVYDVSIADQLLNTASVQVAIRFTGTNDAPRLVGADSVLTGSITELPNVTGSSSVDSASGVVAFDDPDLNDRPTATIGTQTVTWQDATHDYTAELGASRIADLEQALEIAARAGNTNVGAIDWDYDIVDGLLDFLAVGESVTVTSTIVVDDGNGGTLGPQVAVTLYGSNDAPIAAPDSNGTAKATTLTVGASGGVLGNDVDPDVHDLDDLFVSAVAGSAALVGVRVKGTYGTLQLKADGSYVYSAYQGSLPAKIVAQDAFSYTVSDGHGGTDTDTLSIVVFNPGVSYLAGVGTTLVGGNSANVLDGSFGGNVLIGGNAADVLIAGAGNTMTGNNGADIFLFRPAFGANTITDFNLSTDAMQFDKSLYSNVADILANTADTAAGAVISDGSGDTVTLAGVTLADLQAHASVFFLA